MICALQEIGFAEDVVPKLTLMVFMFCQLTRRLGMTFTIT